MTPRADATVAPDCVAAAAANRGATACLVGDLSAAHTASFEALRPRLFGIACRTLESTTDADDVVQDAWIRWQRTDRDEVRDAGAFLATTTKRLALNVAQSARARRDTSIQPWHPEPIDVQADPALGTERREALEFAVLTLLEKLTPAERAAYVLREAFDYPYRRISGVIAVSEANARQLVTRARARLAGGRSRQVSAIDRQRFIDAFVDAAQTGDLTTLEQLLGGDVVTSSPAAIAA